jgi:hypothetical protein
VEVFGTRSAGQRSVIAPGAHGCPRLVADVSWSDGPTSPYLREKTPTAITIVVMHTAHATNIFDVSLLSSTSAMYKNAISITDTKPSTEYGTGRNPPTSALINLSRALRKARTQVFIR